MTKEQAVLFTADPVRNRAWWARTALYWLVLLAQDPGDYSDLRRMAVWALVVIPCGVAVFFRDRYPWVLAVLALLFTAAIAHTPIALGVVAVASRAQRWVALADAALGAGALALPWERVLTSGFTISTSESTLASPALLTLMIALVGLPLVIGMQRRTARLAELDRLAYEAGQRELAANQAVVEERNRIAQEMHDVLGHKLSLITVQAGALEVSAHQGPEVIERQAELIRTTSKGALDDLRSILGVLGDGETDALHPQPGLPETLALIEHNRASGMRITLHNNLPTTLDLPKPVGAALHRVVQEGLTNAQRHAPGATITVDLAQPTPAEISVALTNRPSAQRGSGPGTGRGLPGLGERVRSLGGTLDAGATPEGGYRLAATLPMPEGDA